MPDILYAFFLEFSHATIIAPLLILGYIWIGRNVFYDAICLLFISMIVNVALKVTFQIPLTFKEGFAFPSGHMQIVTILYGWLAFRSQNITFQVLLGGLVAAIGLSLIHFGYHNYYDVLGGVFFAFLLMVTYQLIKIQKPKILPWLMCFGSTILLFYIYYKARIIEPGIWMAYYALLGIIISDLFYKDKVSSKILTKILITLFSISIIFAIKFVFSMQQFSEMPVSLQQFQWFFITYTIPFSSALASRPLAQVLKL